MEQIQVGSVFIAPELGIDQQDQRRRVVHRQWWQTARRRKTGLAAAATATGRQAAQGTQGLGEWQHVSDAS